VTLEPPVLVTVSESDRLLPKLTLPKLRSDGLDPIAPAETPVPDRDTTSVALEAFELMVTVPPALPVVWGAKDTANVVLWEAPRVNGAEIPLS